MCRLLQVLDWFWHIVSCCCIKKYDDRLLRSLHPASLQACNKMCLLAVCESVQELQLRACGTSEQGRLLTWVQVPSFSPSTCIGILNFSCRGKSGSLRVLELEICSAPHAPQLPVRVQWYFDVRIRAAFHLILLFEKPNFRTGVLEWQDSSFSQDGLSGARMGWQRR